MKIRKLLTYEQLLKFCEENKFYSFDSKDSGYTLSVQIPGTLTYDSDSTRGLLFVKVKTCHTLLNRNKSYISEENMTKAMPSLKYRPLLGYIHQLDSGEYDFYAHNIEIVEDENGEEQIEYTEKQIGTFTADDPYLEYDEEADKTYVIATAAIPEDYTKAADIIRRKNGTKVSAELCIDSMTYNAKEKYLELEDFYFMGVTALGAAPDGTQIEEGMVGSRLDIQDFSTANNSIFNHYNMEENQKLIETLEKLNTTLSNFNINNANGKEDNQVKFEELLEKYGKTVEDITFDYEGLSDEELVSAFAEAFDEEDPVVTVDNSEKDAEHDSEENPVVVENEDESEAGSEENPVEGSEEEFESEGEDNSNSNESNEVFVKSFEISHEDIRYALYNLLASYEDADNEWYYITSVYDDYFTYENWNGDKIYGQRYVKDNDNVSFDGERYNLHKELLTDAEYAELQSMRSNYSSIVSKLESYEKKEEAENKEHLFASNEYHAISDADEFKQLNEKREEYSLDELKNKLDDMLLAYAKTGKLNFASVETKPKKVGYNRVNLPVGTSGKNKKKNKYGSLFAK